MTTSTSVSLDSQAVLLVCAHLTPSPAGASSAAPYSPVEWAKLANLLHSSVHKTPSFLLDQPAAALREALSLSPTEAERLCRLLDRGVQLATELERLSSLGIWTLTKADDGYPTRFRSLLRHQAPPVLFGAGERSLLEAPGLAIVGSRHVDQDATDFANAVARRCAHAGLAVVSGAAKGVDRAAMQGALEADGQVIGVMADSLERMIRGADVRRPILDGRLVLATPYHPRAPFSVGAAMGRNKLIYALARFGLVVATSLREGGTWAGAVEILRHRWVPLFVRNGAEAAPGNRALLQDGALPFPGRTDEIPSDLAAWLDEAAAGWSHDGTGRNIPAAGGITPVEEPAAPAARAEAVQLPLFGAHVTE